MVVSVNTGCEPLSASHMRLQWHNKDAASRGLWMETYAGAYSVLNHLALVKILANILHTLKSPSRLQSYGILPHRASASLHLSSHTFPGSASPLLLILMDCTSLDKALASFDALLLESRVVCCKKTYDCECHIS